MFEDWIRPTVTTTLGTLLAALVVFLVGVISGAIEHVSVRTWTTIGAVTVAVLAVAAATVRSNAERKRRAQKQGEALVRNLDEETRVLFSRALHGPALDADETEALLRGVLRAGERRRQAEAKGTDEP